MGEGIPGVSVGTVVGVGAVGVIVVPSGEVLWLSAPDEMFPQAVSRMISMVKKYCLVIFFNL